MRYTRPIWALCALALLSACSGDDGTGLQGDPLTKDEITALMSAIGAATGDLDPTELGIGSGGQFSLDQPCAQGGRVTGSGTATQQGQNRLAFDMSIRYRECRQASEAGVFTLDGTLRQRGSFEFDEEIESLAFDFDLTGDFDWWLGERSGSCEIDVEIGFAQPASFTLSGTICGEPV
jgi:hypothetical protein